MSNSVKVGVVGCGYWGPNLIRNFNSLSNCWLTGICDTDRQRLQHLRKLYPQVECYTNFQEMLQNSAVDAVVIATSLRWHYPMAKASLLAGKHTFIEKPMAASSRECEELIALASDQHRVLMIGHTYLYSAPVRKIKELIKSEEIGEIRYINSRRLNLGLFQKDINVAWDLGPHDISIILHVMEEMPHSVNCQGKAHITPGIEDVTSMTLDFGRGRTAFVQDSWLDPRKVREMTIVGSKKMIVYDDLETLEKIRIYDMRVEIPPHFDTFAEFQFAYHYGDLYVPYLKQEEPLKLETQHFLECIQTGQMPLTNGQQGLEVVRILEASSVSLQAKGMAVELHGSSAAPSSPGSRPDAAPSLGPLS